MDIDNQVAKTHLRARKCIADSMCHYTTVPPGMMPEYARNEIAERVIRQLAIAGLLICTEDEIKEE